MRNNLLYQMKIKDELINATGVILIRLQFLETAVKLCCSSMQVDDKNATYENIFSDDPRKSHFTLGNLIRLLKKPTQFKKEFVEKLDKFVLDRNLFIHKLWTINNIYSLDEEIPEEVLKELQQFLNKLNDDTIFMTRVFIGFHYSIGAHLANMEGIGEQFSKDPNYLAMQKFVPLFLSVVEPE